MKMPLQIYDGAIAPIPYGFLVAQLCRKSLAAKKLGMDPNDQHVFVIGTIEDTDPTAFGKATGSTPQEVVVQFFGAWLLEAEYLTPFGIDAGHHVPNSAVFARAVHTLKNQKQSVTVRRVMKLLQGA
jgi:hypothetical protein